MPYKESSIGSNSSHRREPRCNSCRLRGTFPRQLQQPRRSPASPAFAEPQALPREPATAEQGAEDDEWPRRIADLVAALAQARGKRQVSRYVPSEQATSLVPYYHMNVTGN
jgi:hypothetical protein